MPILMRATPSVRMDHMTYLLAKEAAVVRARSTRDQPGCTSRVLHASTVNRTQT